MNVPLLIFRYAASVAVAALAALDYGAASGLGAFLAFHALWNAGEEAVLAQHNKAQTRRWQQRHGTKP